MRNVSVWALLAVSSDQQAETIAHQRRWAQETAKTRGWRLSRAIEGVATGKEGPRRLLRELITDLRALDAAGRPRYVLMIRLDRVGRGSIVESQIVLRDLQQLGVGVWTRDQGELKLDSAMDELLAAAQLAVARHENEVRIDKMKAVYRRKRAAGEILGNKRPYGLKRDSKHRDVPDGKRGAVVREAFRLRIAGNGYHTIAKRLTAIAPPHAFQVGQKTTERNGKPEYTVRWTPTRVRRLLSNRAYVGVLVDEATFARAQRVAETLSTSERNDDRRRRWPWPLSGAIRCYCGRAMIGMAAGSEPWKVRYYRCNATWNHEVSNRLVRADDLEAQFVALLRELKTSPQVVERYRRRTAPASPRLLERNLKTLKAELSDVAKKRDAAWELHVAGRVRSEDVQERLDALSAKREAILQRVVVIEEQIAIARATANRDRDVEALVKRAPKIFTNAPETDQRKVARAIAVEFGGLCVELDGTLSVRAAVDPTAQRRARSGTT